MNSSVLQTILRTHLVTNGIDTIPLSSAIDAEEGALIQRAIRAIKPSTYLEVGLAYGVSALFAGEALRALGTPYAHHILDPNQVRHWKGIGMHNLKAAGLWDDVVYHDAVSEYRLPELSRSGLVVDMAFIDGWHTFDHTLVDFFYINRMLRVGGVIIFDDTHFPSVAKVIRYVLGYPAFRLYDRTTPMWRSLALRDVARRQYRLLRKGRLNLGSSCIAVQKVAEDTREWDWYAAF